MALVVGLNAYARSGKDTFADVLVSEFGWRRVAFADKLRDVLYALNPIIAISEPRHCSETLREGWPPISTTIYLQDAIDRMGWNGYKETKVGPEIRRLLQRMGTEAGRETLYDSIWVDAALNDIGEHEKVVITDVRFENEADAITGRGGEIWRITRDGVGPANEHISETGLDQYPFDRVISNNGSLESFRDLARYIGEEYY